MFPKWPTLNIHRSSCITKSKKIYFFLKKKMNSLTCIHYFMTCSFVFKASLKHLKQMLGFVEALLEMEYSFPFRKHYIVERRDMTWGFVLLKNPGRSIFTNRRHVIMNNTKMNAYFRTTINWTIFFQ